MSHFLLIYENVNIYKNRNQARSRFGVLPLGTAAVPVAILVVMPHG